MSSVVLIRHVESEKNVTDSFATAEGAEVLTALGLEQLNSLVDVVPRILDRVGGPPLHIFSGTSRRVVDTASAIARAIGSDVQVIAGLDSFVSPVIEGMSFSQLERADPATARQIRLYRAGAGNSYGTHPSFEGAVRDFEARVQAALLTALDLSPGTVVVVGSRSAITAAVIHFARLEGFYPPDFYGYISLPTGSLTIVRRPDSEDLSWTVESVGADVRQVLSGLDDF